MKKIIFIILFTGITLTISWPPYDLNFLVFLSFVPIVYLVNKTKSFSLIFLVSYLAFLIWHIFTLYWLFNVSYQAAFSIILINPLIISLTLLVYKLILNSKTPFAVYSIVPVFILLEYFQNNEVIGFPFLNLGNVLGNYSEYIHWYEYTGAIGGSALILYVNIIIYRVIFQPMNKSSIIFNTLIISSVTIFSYFPVKKTITTPFLVNILHSNMDSRTEKKTLTNLQIIDKFLAVINSNLEKKANLIIWPETAIPTEDWFEDLQINDGINKIKNFASDNSVNIITGIVLNLLVQDNEKKLKINTSKFTIDSNLEYVTFNGSLLIPHDNTNYQFRNKNILVPIEENNDFGIISRIIPSMGQYGFSRLKNNRKSFLADGIKFGYLICYESIFFSEASKMTQGDSQFLVVGLNESWYNSIAASKQFENISRIRALEQRKYIVRSSNGGTSSVIDDRGNLIYTTSEKGNKSINYEIHPNNIKTFFSMNTYLLLKCAILYFAIIILLILKNKLFLIHKN